MNYNSSVHTGKSDDDDVCLVFHKACNQMLHGIFITRLERYMILMALAGRAQSWLTAGSPNGAADRESGASKNIYIGVL